MKALLLTFCAMLITATIWVAGIKETASSNTLMISSVAVRVNEIHRNVRVDRVTTGNKLEAINSRLGSIEGKIDIILQRVK